MYGSKPADGYTFSYGNDNAHRQLGTGFSYIMESDQQLRG
jgi:hypothetical protein